MGCGEAMGGGGGGWEVGGGGGRRIETIQVCRYVRSRSCCCFFALQCRDVRVHFVQS